jgi:hypothetical protein
MRHFRYLSLEVGTLARYTSETAADGAEGRMVVMNEQAETWPSWERHPAGDELVLLLEGRITPGAGTEHRPR